jgi:hypothetical protein
VGGVAHAVPLWANLQVREAMSEAQQRLAEGVETALEQRWAALDESLAAAG